MNLPPFQLERYFAKHEFSCRYLLCASDCESLTTGELLALEPGAEQRFLSQRLGYTESFGSPVLREAIADLYSGIGADGILVHSGAQEAIYNFMRVVVEPGDEIIVHTPCYQSLAEVARTMGGRVHPWRADRQRGWQLNMADLKSMLNPQVRMVVINIPHNPTGWLANEDFLGELAKLADTHGFLIFSDEVYRGLEMAPATTLPAMAEFTDRAVSLGVMSKTYGLAGLRIGWIATMNRNILSKLAIYKDYTTICNSAPSEFLATLALRHWPEIISRNLAIISENRDLLSKFFTRYDTIFTWQAPVAGPIAFPTLRHGLVDDFCADLVRDSGVLLLPGTMYGGGYNEFRIGFGRSNFSRCLAAFEDWLTTRGELK